MASLGPEIRTFLWSFIGHWQSYATGGVVTGIISVVERLSRKQLPRRVYFMVFVVTFSVAGFFMAWREQYERAKRAEASISSKPLQPAITVNVPPAQVIIQGRSEDTKVSGPSGLKNAGGLGVGQRRTKAKTDAAAKTIPEPLDTHTQSTPSSEAKPSVASVRIASQKAIVSTDHKLPWGLEVVIQTDINIEPVAFGLLCDGPVGKGDAGFSSGGVYIQTKTGQLGGNQNSFGFEWKSPAFTPDSPIIIRLFSREQIRVIGFQSIRYVWP